MKRLRLVLIGLAVAGAALAVAGYAIISSIDLNDYKQEIAEQVRQATGRDLTIAGDVGLEISLQPAVVAESVSLSNPPGMSRANMASLDRVLARIELLPLLSGEVRILSVVLEGLDLRLERNADGNGNWAFDPVEAPASAEVGETGPLPRIDAVRLRDVVIAYGDQTTGAAYRLTLDTVDVDAPAGSGVMAVVAEGTVQDAALRVEGDVGALTALSGSDPYPVALQIDLAGLRIGVEGSIADPQAATGMDLRLTASGNDLSGLSTLAGVDLPSDRPFELSGRFSDGEAAYGLDGISFSAGETAISGWVAVSTRGDRPKVDAQLLADAVNLDDLPLPVGAGGESGDGGGAGDGGGTGDGRIFSDDPLPLAVLMAADADVDIQASRLTAGDVVLSNVALNLVLDGGRLTVEPLKATIAGGVAEGLFSLDASSGEAAAMAAKLTVSGADGGQLARDLGGQDILNGGPTDILVDLSGSGDTQQSLFASLTGTVQVSVGPGQLNNSALDTFGGDVVSNAVGALNPFAGESTQSRLKCAAVRFVAADGQARADRGIALETQKMVVVGSGAIDLASESIDFVIKPEAREGLGINLGGVASIVRVTGTLGEPSVGLNPLEAGKKALSVGAAIATGGLSLLAEGVFDRITAVDSPCRVALGQDSGSAASGSGGSGGGAQPGDAGGARGVDGLIQGIDDMFGN